MCDRKGSYDETSRKSAKTITCLKYIYDLFDDDFDKK